VPHKDSRTGAPECQWARNWASPADWAASRGARKAAIAFMPARAAQVAPSLKLGLRVHSSKERQLRLGRFYIRRPTGRTLSDTKAPSALSDPALEFLALRLIGRPGRKYR
jgi:hypothetical protein